ncbi:hypothetical protein V8E51_007550 [Hyaloscypha variabilis]
MGGNQSEPLHAMEEKGKESFWYDNDISREITMEFRKFIKAYSGIPHEKISEHVYKAIRAYPCTGQDQFLNPLSGRSLVYREVDYSGAPSENIYAVDIVSHWDVGYIMFNDCSRFHVTFIETDILCQSSYLKALNSAVNIIWASKVLHQRDWATQLVSSRSLVALSKPGTMVVGFRADYLKAEFLEEETGTSWDAGQVSLRRFDDLGISLDSVTYLGDKCRMLEFVVRRVS